MSFLTIPNRWCISLKIHNENSFFFTLLVWLNTSAQVCALAEHLYSHYAFEQSEVFKCGNYTVTGCWEKAQLRLHLHPQQVMHHTFTLFDKNLKRVSQKRTCYCVFLTDIVPQMSRAESHSCSLASGSIEHCVISWPPVHSSLLLSASVSSALLPAHWHSVSVVHFAVK